MIRHNKQVDYIGMWFDVRREHGINDDMRVGPMNIESNEVSWNIFHHREMDGLGGMATVLRQHGFPCRELPKSSEKQPPSLLSMLRLMWRMPKSEVPKTIRWKHTYDHYSALNPKNSNDAPIATDYFTLEETVRIKRLAKKHRVTLGVYIFWALNRAIADNLLDGEQEYYWFYPVNLRGALQGADDTRNYSSGVNILMSNQIAPKEIQARIKEQMKLKAYWVLWWQANIGKIIGLKGVRWLYKVVSGRQYYAGSFSFLGSWPLKDADNPPVRDDEVWVSCGIGTKNYPVSTGIMLWNDQLTLGLKLHPFISQDKVNTLRCLGAWKQYLLTGNEETQVAKQERADP